MVKIGEVAVGRGEGILASVGVGSCIIIILYHRATQVGGLAHVLLPSEEYSSNKSNPCRFPQPAVREMLRQMERLGARSNELWGKIVGGASLFTPPGKRSVGVLNVQAARAALADAGIGLQAEDTLGGQGRSVYFNLADGLVRVRVLGGGEKII
jgi:chemotaxis protein CheD